MLPLFPLELVLFPGMTVPLHIFEERYKELIGEAHSTESEFGIALLQGSGILRTGCSAVVAEIVNRYDDGRMDILVEGRRRFHIRDLNNDRSFLQGEVEFFEDLDSSPAPSQSCREALARFAEVSELLDDKPELPLLDEPQLSFRLAQASTDLGFRQTLLGVTSETRRLEMVKDHLGQLVLKLKAQTAMRKVARSNGHGPVPPSEIPEL
jgi:Lon protease-like protein